MGICFSVFRTGVYSSTTYSYNSLNQLSSRTCNNLTEQYYYDSNGYKSGSSINGQDVWQLLDYNGMQSIVQLGDSLTSITKRNLKGVTQLAVVHGNDTISNFRYEYSNTTDNVTSRTGMQSAREDFGYDSLDRLTAVTSSGQTLLQMSYADNGNISSKTGLRNFTYSQTHPHAVEQIGRTPLAYGLASLATTYNEFNKIESIVQGNTSASFIYGPDQERWKSVLTKGCASRTILYGDDYERITAGDTVRHFYYLDGGAIYVMESGKPDKLLFACTDNLGSIVKLVDDGGSSVFNARYDVWGYQTVTKNQIGFHRGFTGHEMLPEFCLVNMNGRMYDPIVGRFLSPDNYIQFDNFSQSYNRYSYCLNNPLKYKDPSGEFWEMVIASALFGAIQSGAMADMNGGNFWDGVWKGAIVSAVSAVTTYGVGFGMSHWLSSLGASKTVIGFVSNTFSSAAGGFVGGVGNSCLFGSSFNSSLHSGFFSSAIYAASSATFEGLSSLASCFDAQAIPHSLNYPDFAVSDAIMLNNVDVIAYNYRTYAAAAMNIFNQIYNTKYGLTSGFMLFPKAWWHYQFGAGDPLFIDASSLYLNKLRQTDIGPNNILQTFRYDNINNTSLTIGNVEVTNVWDNQYFITDEDYDFDFNQDFSRKNLLRNFIL